MPRPRSANTRSLPRPTLHDCGCVVTTTRTPTTVTQRRVEVVRNADDCPWCIAARQRSVAPGWMQPNLDDGVEANGAASQLSDPATVVTRSDDGDASPDFGPVARVEPLVPSAIASASRRRRRA